MLEDKEEKEEKPKSSCCDAEVLIRESGVSQLSFDVRFFCSKCGKELEDVKTSDFKHW